ncbi:dephospho-CoA kinase [Thalassotalea insulae]|uniref:Dephospho-CoA kinase n=1 Tax=Thalassotalea insulae TaxID=2056778 RepID=A0ABQ6GRG7_9GAMM|nr:dephospho-CoA kinase [Thalassotalea insulae]GLX77784.1 dephospho-CoA kinase [Thalassotalea insulae]
MADFIVGLTGGIGSGKTTISNLFAKLGVNIIDADVIARDVVKPGSPALTAITHHFGQQILQNNGQLNRGLLRAIIFKNQNEKAWLNQLMHPLIRTAITNALKECPGSYCILSAPLLFENKLNAITNRDLVIDVSPTTQIKRTTGRDDVDEQQVQAIIDSQMARSERLALADDVIDNESSDLAQVKQKVAKLHQQYQTLARK